LAIDIHDAKPPLDFNKEIKKIYTLFQDRRYIEVIIIGVQLMEIIAIWIESCRIAGEAENIMEYLEYGDNDEYDRFIRIYEEYNNVAANYRSRESSRLKFIEMLYHEFSMEEATVVKPSLFQKANRVFAFRNKIAHDYYYDSSLIRKSRIRAKDCIDILLLFVNNQYF